MADKRDKRSKDVQREIRRGKANKNKPRRGSGVQNGRISKNLVKKNTRPVPTRTASKLDPRFRKNPTGNDGQLVNMPVCSIDIEGFGKVAFPVYSLINQIKSHFTEAHGGALELLANEFTISNPAFEEYVQEKVLPLAKASFDTYNGVWHSGTKAVLEKLVIYEKGAHSGKSETSKKEKGHFANLVIQLPSEYTGGTVTSTITAVEKTIDHSSMTQGKPNGNEFHGFFHAYFRDVAHKVNIVKSGCKVVLVYRLIDTKRIVNEG